MKYENGKAIVECEMTLEEYRFCEGILVIENGKKFWEEVWEIVEEKV